MRTLQLKSLMRSVDMAIGIGPTKSVDKRESNNGYSRLERGQDDQ